MDAQRDAFFLEQSRLQEQHYDEHLPGLERQVITYADEPVGRLYLARPEGMLSVVDIALLPRHRGRGIGSALMAEILAESEARSVTVRLHVELNNPASQWYARLGFRETGVHGAYVRMDYTPRSTGIS